MEWLTIEDLLLIAEAVLDVPGEQLVRSTRLDAARAVLAAVERQPTLADAAAVLCRRLVQERPLPCGNAPVALLAMLELVSRNRGVWVSPSGGEREVAATIARLAAGELSPTAFRAWVRAHVRSRWQSAR
jgi:prophage maintenance system killer protein